MPRLASRTTRQREEAPFARYWIACLVFLVVFVAHNARMQAAVLDSLSIASISYDAPSYDVSSEASLASGAKPKDRLSLAELTKNPPLGSLECPSMTSPIYDRVVQGTDDNNTQKIQKIVHLSFKTRCIGTTIYADTVQRWKDELPDYSVYYHDDEAVDRLLQQDWPEFPHLHKIMQCVKFKGAMKSDIWRVLVLYKYGGIWSDIDNVPAKEFKNGTVIRPDDTFFAASDTYNRPMQNTFAMEAEHPIGFFAMNIILDNVLNMPDLTAPKVVVTTGPNALRYGYSNWLEMSGQSDGLKPGFYTGFMNKTVHKEPIWIWKHPHGYENVVYKGEEMSKIERDNRISGSVHWTKRRDNSEGLGHLKGMSCREYLYRLDHPAADEMQLANNKF